MMKKWPKLPLLVSLLASFLWIISVYFHHETESSPLRLNLFQDGSFHPLTYLSEKVDAKDLYGRAVPKRDIWKWIPKKYVDIRYKFMKLELSANPFSLNNGDVTTVRWSDPLHEASLDILVLYCPSNASISDYIDYWLVKKLQRVIEYRNGGQVRIALYNTRENCEFRMFSNQTQTELVAVSNEIKFIDAKEVPIHGHLALTGNSDEMRVQWTSGIQYTPIVYYGQSPYNVFQYSVIGTSSTYSAKDLCGPPANLSHNFINPGFLNDVLLPGLKHNTRYFYKFGGIGYRLSEVKNFTSSLPRGSDKTFKFVVYGDMDVTAVPGAETTAKLVLKEAIKSGLSFVLHIGDLSYAMGLAYLWDEWMSLIEPYSSLVPYMVSIGNHEQVTGVGNTKDPSTRTRFMWNNAIHDSGGECGIPAMYRFHMPNNGNRLWWYSFDYGSVHLVQLSTEHDVRPGSEQYRWLSNDLTKVDRSITPWVIVTAHRTIYSSQKAKSDYLVSLEIRKALEDLLNKWKVDLCITGHLHSYERSCRVYKSHCYSRKGITYIVVGTAGCGVEKHIGRQHMRWTRHFEERHGYGKVTVNRTYLLWEFVRNRDEVVSDSMTLRKNKV